MMRPARCKHSKSRDAAWSYLCVSQLGSRRGGSLTSAQRPSMEGRRFFHALHLCRRRVRRPRMGGSQTRSDHWHWLDDVCIAARPHPWPPAGACGPPSVTRPVSLFEGEIHCSSCCVWEHGDIWFCVRRWYLHWPWCRYRREEHRRTRYVGVRSCEFEADWLSGAPAGDRASWPVCGPRDASALRSQLDRGPWRSHIDGQRRPSPSGSGGTSCASSTMIRSRTPRVCKNRLRTVLICELHPRIPMSCNIFSARLAIGVRVTFPSSWLHTHRYHHLLKRAASGSVGCVSFASRHQIPNWKQPRPPRHKYRV
ncbi:hypothetical protein C8Q79DRAFT_706319 [Trametes meyenii]|nr:hypothetical protein C8Q79DRAFT_706319 [Trametes meyenii]